MFQTTNQPWLHSAWYWMDLTRKTGSWKRQLFHRHFLRHHGLSSTSVQPKLNFSRRFANVDVSKIDDPSDPLKAAHWNISHSKKIEENSSLIQGTSGSSGKLVELWIHRFNASCCNTALGCPDAFIWHGKDVRDIGRHIPVSQRMAETGMGQKLRKVNRTS